MNPSLHNFSALTTDLYEITMACGYFKAGMAEHEAAFHVTFRENPFAGQLAIAGSYATGFVLILVLGWIREGVTAAV